MAMSLLYALLGVNDIETLNDIEASHKVYNAQPQLLATFNDEKHNQYADEKRALKYRSLGNKGKKEVKKALYKALYEMVEYSDINPDVNMAIGKALCNAMSENPQENLKDHPGIVRLRYVLKPIVADAIDEI